MTPPSRPKILITLWVAFWLLMICTSMQDALRNPHTAWWEPVLWEGSSAAISTGWMWLAVRGLAHQAPHLDTPLVWFVRYLRWLPLVIVSWIAAVYPIRHGVYALAGWPYTHPGWGYVVLYESVKLTIFTTLWLGILFGVDSYDQWRSQRDRLLHAQKALAQAQLAQLQGQLRPHFLFNALNTVSALMQTDVERADRLVATLGDLLRVSLRSTESEMTTLAEELRTLALYAEVMCERFRHRVALTWQTAGIVSETPVPALLLQPLLENAFKHGVERTALPVRIHICAYEAHGLLQVVVRNSGSRLAADARDGVGLRNCKERLDILYGHMASLRVDNEGDGVAAHVRLPLTGIPS